VKRTNSDMARRVRIRAVVAYPAATAALVVSVALALTPFGTSQVMALDASPTPTDSTTASATASPTPSPTSSANPSATPPSTASPVATAAAGVTPRSTAGATPHPATTPSPVPGPSPRGVVAPAGVPIDHHVLGWVSDSGFKARYFPVDASVLDASQFQTLRVRFTIHNAGTAPLTARPLLEYRPAGSGGYVAVPEDSVKGIPLSMNREWVPSNGGGTRQGPLGEDIAVARFLTGDQGGGLALIGHHSMGANPDRQITLPPDSYTEQEFSVRLTTDARYLAGYDLRITGGHGSLAGAQVAKIRLGPPPALRLSPGQRNGVAVKDPRPASGTGAVR